MSLANPTLDDIWKLFQPGRVGTLFMPTELLTVHKVGKKACPPYENAQ
jgi:hypothetical protein